MTSTADDAPAILLTHGFWHGAWCWNDVLPYLIGAGRRALAVDLAGHGLRARRPDAAGRRPFDPVAYASEISPLAAVDLDAAADLLIDQIHDLAERGPVTVVAHSFGGPVVTRAAQTVPHLVHHLVYVTAIMPASGVPAGAYLDTPEQRGQRVASLLVGDPAGIGALRLDVTDPDMRGPLRQAFYADVELNTADAAISLLTPDAPIGIAGGATALDEEGWGSLPRTYVYCSRDLANMPALQRRFVREADSAFPDNPTRVVDLDSGHSPFLSQPETLAQVIARC